MFKISNRADVCPFCGKSEFLEVQDGLTGYISDDFLVWCRKCDIWIPEKIWHRRPVENELKEYANSLEQQLEELKEEYEQNYCKKIF